MSKVKKEPRPGVELPPAVEALRAVRSHGVLGCACMDEAGMCGERGRRPEIPSAQLAARTTTTSYQMQAQLQQQQRQRQQQQQHDGSMTCEMQNTMLLHIFQARHGDAQKALASNDAHESDDAEITQTTSAHFGATMLINATRGCTARAHRARRRATC